MITGAVEFLAPQTNVAGGTWKNRQSKSPMMNLDGQRWATMTSVIENNPLQEDWVARQDSGQQWRHCSVAPLYIGYHGLAGILPLAPGFRRVEVRPQLADLQSL